MDSELLGDLGLDPLQQRFLGAHLPLVLRLPVDAPLSDGAVILSPAGVASPTGTGEPLAELLQNSSVLLDLEIKMNVSLQYHRLLSRA